MAAFDKWDLSLQRPRGQALKISHDYGFVFYSWLYEPNPKSSEGAKSSFMRHWKEHVDRDVWKILAVCFFQNWNSLVVSLRSRERLNKRPCSLWTWEVCLERKWASNPGSWPGRAAQNLLPPHCRQVLKVYRVPSVFLVLFFCCWLLVFFFGQWVSESLFSSSVYRETLN